MYFEAMKISAIAWTWILRGLGLLCLLPLIFANQFVWYFPAMDDPRILRALLWVGSGLFVSGAILYHVVRKRIKNKSEEFED